MGMQGPSFRGASGTGLLSPPRHTAPACPDDWLDSFPCPTSPNCSRPWTRAIPRLRTTVPAGLRGIAQAGGGKDGAGRNPARPRRPPRWFAGLDPPGGDEPTLGTTGATFFRRRRRIRGGSCREKPAGDSLSAMEAGLERVNLTRWKIPGGAREEQLVAVDEAPSRLEPRILEG